MVPAERETTACIRNNLQHDTHHKQTTSISNLLWFQPPQNPTYVCFRIHIYVHVIVYLKEQLNKPKHASQCLNFSCSKALCLCVFIQKHFITFQNHPKTAELSPARMEEHVCRSTSRSAATVPLVSRADGVSYVSITTSVHSQAYKHKPANTL